MIFRYDLRRFVNNMHICNSANWILMNIGFDAKRAYHNGTGLGHYSRTLIRSLAEYFPYNEYYLFNPKASDLFQLSGKNVHEVLPSGILHKALSSVWRS